jgi:hypothetical protein
VFHTDVAKVDWDVAYVAMVVHQASIPNVLFIFQTYVASVFIWMLHMLYTYVASVSSGCYVCLNGFSSVFKSFFASILDACFKCFIYILLYVASVTSGCFKSRLRC